MPVAARCRSGTAAAQWQLLRLEELQRVGIISTGMVPAATTSIIYRFSSAGPRPRGAQAQTPHRTRNLNRARGRGSVPTPGKIGDRDGGPVRVPVPGQIGDGDRTGTGRGVRALPVAGPLRLLAGQSGRFFGKHF